jgi:hypothetical protein
MRAGTPHDAAQRSTFASRLRRNPQPWVVAQCLRRVLTLPPLLEGSIENFLVVVLLTGPPVMLLLVAWSIHYAIRGLTEGSSAQARA